MVAMILINDNHAKFHFRNLINVEITLLNWTENATYLGMKLHTKNNDDNKNALLSCLEQNLSSFGLS